MLTINKRIKTLQKAVENKIDQRNKYYAARSEKWKESTPGHIYDEDTCLLGSLNEDLKDWKGTLPLVKHTHSMFKSI